MKNTITITIALCSLLPYQIGHAQSTLQVNIKNCRHENDFAHLDEFKIYKNDNDGKATLFKTVKTKQKNKQIIDKLSVGKYKIKYKTTFKKTETIINPTGIEKDFLYT